MTPAELPYRALFRTLDGRKTSKSNFEGPISQTLAGPVHELPLAEFWPLACTELLLLPAEVEKSLNSDMRLLFQYVTTGDGSPVARRIHGQPTQRAGTLRKAACCCLYGAAEPQP